MNRNDFDDEESDDDDDDNNNNYSHNHHHHNNKGSSQLLFIDYEVDSILANHYFVGTIVNREIIIKSYRIPAVKLRVQEVSIPPAITYIIPGTTTNTTTNITSTNITSTTTSTTTTTLNTTDSTSNRVEQTNIATNNHPQLTQQQQQQIHINPSELAYDEKSSYDRIYNKMKLLHSHLYRTCNYGSVEINIDDNDDENVNVEDNDMKTKRKNQKIKYKNIKEQIFKLKDRKEVMVMIDVSYHFIKQLISDYHNKYQKPRKIIVQKFRDYYHNFSMKEKQVVETELTQLYNCEEQFFVILTRAGKCKHNVYYTVVCTVYVLCTFSVRTVYVNV